jgi:hypothetical protein
VVEREATSGRGRWRRRLASGEVEKVPSIT